MLKVHEIRSPDLEPPHLPADPRNCCVAIGLSVGLQTSPDADTFAKASAAELKPVPEAPEARWTDVPQLPQRDLAWYRQQGYAFLVTSSKRWRQLTMPPEYG